MSGISQMLLGPLNGTKNLVVNLVGVNANGSIGTVFTSEVTEVNITGVQALAQVRPVTAAIVVTETVTGVGATGQVSPVNASMVITVPAIGVQSLAQVGSSTTVASGASIQLTGVSGSSQIGIATAIGESEAFPLPANSVLIWGASGAAAPSGFSIMDLGTKDYLIMGASTIGEANTFTSTAGTLTISGTSPSTGAHSTPWSPAGSNPSGFGSSFPNQAGPAGTHSHNVSSSSAIPVDTLPNGFGIKLITNASEVSEIPTDAIMFCDTAKSGFIRKQWAASSSYGVYIARNNTVSTNGSVGATASPFSLSVSSSGAHQHTSPSTTGPGGIVTGRISNVSAGSHTHPISTPSLNLYLYQYFKHLLPFIATTDSAVRSGMIVMFKGSVVPSGWSLCNGSNGTPDMRSYFLGYDNDIDTTDNVRGSRAAKASNSAPPVSANTSATYTPSPISATLNTVTWPHSHAGSPRNITNQQLHYHSTKSVPHSHSISSLALSVPTSFLPNTFRLAFIQKD